MKKDASESLGRVLFGGEGFSARLAWYPPGFRLAAHAHARHQVSILLSGTLGEEVGNDDARLACPAVGVKPAGSVHANDYGPQGALLLGFEFDACTDLRRQFGVADRWSWRRRPSPALLAGSRALLAGLRAARDDLEDRAWDLVAAIGLEDDGSHAARRAGRTPPPWVARVEARLNEDSASLAEIAGDEGMHPVAVSRGFERWTGCRPSAVRRQARLHRALDALAQGHALADAAAMAGFADQPHFNRVARACSGLSPGQLRTMLRHA